MYRVDREEWLHIPIVITSYSIHYTKLYDDAPLLRVVNVKEKYPYIFDWLSLLDMNVWIILLLMVLVAGFNMISGLLVIILERTLV